MTFHEIFRVISYAYCNHDLQLCRIPLLFEFANQDLYPFLIPSHFWGFIFWNQFLLELDYHNYLERMLNFFFCLFIFLLPRIFCSLSPEVNTLKACSIFKDIWQLVQKYFHTLYVLQRLLLLFAQFLNLTKYHLVRNNLNYFPWYIQVSLNLTK